MDQKVEKELEKCMNQLEKGPVGKVERQIVYEQLFRVFRKLEILKM